MTRTTSKALWMLVAWCALACASCSEPSTPPQTSQSWPAVCDGGPSLTLQGVDPQVHTIGPSSNVLTRAGDALWVVESLSNTVSRLELDTGAFVPGALDVGADRNPYDVAFDPTRAYITNYASDSVSVLDRATGAQIAEITHPSLDNPSGVAHIGQRLYVSNVRFRGVGYDAGTVSVFALDTWEHLATVEVEALNPQFLSTVERQGATALVVASTGALSFEGGGARLASDGGVELWTPTDDPAAPTVERFALPLDEDAPTVGGLGRGLVQGENLYFTSATAPVVFKLNLKDARWEHDAQAPLQFAPIQGDALHHGHIDSRELLWITSFNEDAMYVWDTRCDALLAGPIELGVDPKLVEGPHGVRTVQTAQGADVWFIMSQGNVLGRLRVSFDPS